MRLTRCFPLIALWALCIGGYVGGGGGSSGIPVISDDGTAAGGVLAGAPRDEGFFKDAATGRVTARFNVLPHVPVMQTDAGTDIWGAIPAFDASPTLFFKSWGLWATTGATDTSLTTNDGVQLLQTTDSSDFTKFNFVVENSDSTEGVFGSMSLVNWTDTTSFFYRSKFSSADFKSHFAVGLWDGLQFKACCASNRGSGFDGQDPGDNLWDGSPNNSNNHVAFYFIASDTTAGGAHDQAYLRVQFGEVADTASVFIPIASVSEDLGQAGTLFDIAFTVFGYDSVQYAINDSTGTLDLTSITPGAESRPISWRVSQMDAGTGLPFNALTFTDGWFATKPR